MNDLAEKALHGLDVARKQVRDRPMLSLAVPGFVVSTGIVTTGGRVGAARSTRALTTWLGLEDSHGASAQDRVPGSLMFAGVAALVALWLVSMEVVRRTRQPQRRVWWLAGAWAAPFALGPPLLDTSVYSYAAYGLLQRNGLDPYTSAPARLGSKVVAAIDPGAREAASSAGPLGTLLQHLSVSISSGSALGAVIVLRVVGVLAAVWISRLAVELGDGSGRSLSVCALNPLVLLYVVSAPHLDGLMMAVLLTAIVAATRDRWLPAVALAAVAGALLPQALVAVPILVAAHRLARPSREWRAMVGGVLVAGVITAAAGFVQPGGFGWLRTVRDQFSVDTPFSVAGATARIIAPIVRSASYDDLAAGGRLTAVIAAACTVVYLVVTARHRPVERSVGYALLGIALLAPVLHPWYLLWGVLCLAPAAEGGRRICVLALSTLGCLLTPPGFSQATSYWITGAVLVVVGAAAIGPLIRADRRARAEAASEPQPAQLPPATSRTAGRTSAR